MATIRPTGYLAHYGIDEEEYLEHYGVKGMKWGKHKSRVATFVDQRITGTSAKKAAKEYSNMALQADVKLVEAQKYAKQASTYVGYEAEQEKKFSKMATNQNKAAEQFTKNEEHFKKLGDTALSVAQSPRVSASLKKSSLEDMKYAYDKASKAKEEAKNSYNLAKKYRASADEAKKSYNKMVQQSFQRGAEVRAARNEKNVAKAKARSAQRAYDQSLVAKGKKKVSSLLSKLSSKKSKK